MEMLLLCRVLALWKGLLLKKDRISTELATFWNGLKTVLELFWTETEKWHIFEVWYVVRVFITFSMYWECGREGGKEGKREGGKEGSTGWRKEIYFAAKYVLIYGRCLTCGPGPWLAPQDNKNIFKIMLKLYKIIQMLFIHTNSPRPFLFTQCGPDKPMGWTTIIYGISRKPDRKRMTIWHYIYDVPTKCLLQGKHQILFSGTFRYACHEYIRKQNASTIDYLWIMHRA